MELYAALIVLQQFPYCPINIYSDSRYVVGALQKLEMVPKRLQVTPQNRRGGAPHPFRPPPIPILIFHLNQPLETLREC